MNVTEAVLSRRSIRAFLDTPVSLDLIREIVVNASRAPSNSNIQPWQIRVVAGQAIEQLKQVMAERAKQEPRFDELQYHVYPEGLDEPYVSRRFRCGENQYNAVGIAREDQAGRWQYVLGNMQFFGAPVGLFCFVRRDMRESQWADLGCYIQTLMLLLREAGLDSCAQISWCLFNKTVRDFLQMGEEWMLYCGMSIGYRDPDAPVNQISVGRAVPDEFVKFVVEARAPSGG